MKKFFFLLLPIVLILCTCEKESDIVNIPDVAFLNALINEGIDANGDNLISYAEAEAVDSLVCGSYHIEGGTFTPAVVVPNYGDIKSLEGLKAFKNLQILDCSLNDITSLDVSNNFALTRLKCWENQLTSLDVSNCTELIELECFGNELKSLSLSNNSELESLVLGHEDSRYINAAGMDSQFTKLDIYTNSKLK